MRASEDPGGTGLERGYCMMIGGEKDVVQHFDPIFSTLAPGIGEEVWSHRGYSIFTATALVQDPGAFGVCRPSI